MRIDVIRELRESLFPVPDNVTDDDILKVTEGTLLRLSCEFRDLIREIFRVFGLNLF